MLGKTHLIGGAAAATATCMITPGIGRAEATVLFAACLLGSVLPDIDHRKSKISNSDILIGAASEVIGICTKHRGIIHTPVGCILLGATGYLAANRISSCVLGNAALAMSIIVFTAVHVFCNKKGLAKCGGLLAVATYFLYPKFSCYVDVVPFPELPEKFAYFIGVGIFAGALSHIVLDMLNPEGIMVLYPYRRRYHIASVKTGTRGEAAVTAFIFPAILCALWCMLGTAAPILWVS